MAEQPFTIQGPVTQSKKGSHSGEYAIYREFPIVATPEVLAAMRIEPDEVVDGVVMGEQEIIIDPDIYYQRSTFKGSHLQPPDPDEWMVEGYKVVALNGVDLSKEDAAALEAYLGELTEDEEDRIHDSWRDRGMDEPDYPDPDDYDDFID